MAILLDDVKKNMGYLKYKKIENKQKENLSRGFNARFSPKKRDHARGINRLDELHTNDDAPKDAHASVKRANSESFISDPLFLPTRG